MGDINIITAIKKQHKGISYVTISTSTLFDNFGNNAGYLAPENEPDKDYIVYYFNNNEDLYLGYHPSSGLIDTFTTEDNPFWWMEASADGKYLFVATRYYVSKVDLQTLQTVATLPYRAVYGRAISPDNQYLALLMGPGIVVVRINDFTVLHEDTLLNFYNCTFTSDSKKIYGYVGFTYNLVTILDIENNFSQSTIELPQGLAIELIVPSIDESKLFLVCHYGMWFSRFEVYDVELDSIIFREWLWAGYNFIKLSPDNI